MRIGCLAFASGRLLDGLRFRDPGLFEHAGPTGCRLAWLSGRLYQNARNPGPLEGE